MLEYIGRDAGSVLSDNWKMSVIGSDMLGYIYREGRGQCVLRLLEKVCDRVRNVRITREGRGQWILRLLENICVRNVGE